MKNSFEKEFNQIMSEKKEIPVKVLPLHNILNQYANKFDHIDILNIDVEGFDLEVVKSNDWSKFRPSVIVIELNCKSIHDIKDNETAKYLCNLGYDIIAKNVILPNVASVFFADKNFAY